MIKNYIMMAFAVMRRRKLITALNLLGISFTLAFLTVIYALYDLQYGEVYPLQNTDKIVFYNGVSVQMDLKESKMISVTSKGEVRTNSGQFVMNLGNDYKSYQQLKDEIESVKYFSFHRNREFGFFHDGKYLTLMSTYTDAGFWGGMNFDLIDGRYFSEDDVENKNYVAVVSENTAVKLYPDANAIGKYIKLGKNSYTIIGVVADVGMKSMAFADVWVPITTIYRFSERHRGNVTLFLKDNANATDASREITNWYKKSKDDIIKDLYRWDKYKPIFPDEIILQTFGEMGYMQTFLSLISPSKVRGLRRSLGSIYNNSGELFKMQMVFWVAILLFLAIPVINMVNLNSSQVADRASEIGVRKSFGATTSHLVSQFLAENIIITLIGGLLSIVFAMIAMNLLKDHFLNINPLRDVVGSFHLNWRIITWSFIITVVFGIISGVMPAYIMSKLNAVNAIKGRIK